MSPYAAEPPSEPSSPAPSAGFRDARTLRPGSSLAVGGVGAACGFALLIPALLAADRNWALISSVVLALVLLWLFIVRPCAVIHAEGIRLVNPLRTADLTWPAIEEVRSRWALELFSGGARYTAWGIPADPARPRYGRGVLALGANKVLGGRQVPEGERRARVEAQAVAAEVDARIAADRRRKDGRPAAIAVQAWDPVAVGLLLGALAFFVVAVFVA